METSEFTSKRYKQLIEISRDLASTLELDILLKRIVSVASEITDSEAASILLYDEQKKQLRFQTASNEASQAKIYGIIVPTDSLAGWVALNREPVVVADVHKDDRWFTNVGEELEFRTHSIIAVPMVAKGKLIGVLEALNKCDGTYSDSELEVLSVLGAQAAVAIENARLFQQSDLISELVHEIRTPLSSINTVAYLLQRPETTGEQRMQMVKTIQDETRRLNELASSFLDLARLESGRVSFELSSFHVRELLVECGLVIKPRADENEVVIIIEEAEEAYILEADRDQIKQVILNLLSNAVKYNRPKGSIFVSTERVGSSIRLSIKDTGLGLSEEDLSHLFEKFFRASSSEKNISGTGLGLSISKRIIDGHGGQINVQSQLNVGTTFSISLPEKQTDN
jgi:signal transduction histidine kinase